MHQLMRVQKGSNLLWKQPTKVDNANMHPASIVECIIDGEWDVSKERNISFKLQNHSYISDLVTDLTNDNHNYLHQLQYRTKTYLLIEFKLMLLLL